MKNCVLPHDKRHYMKFFPKLRNPNFLTLSAIVILGGFLRLFQITKNALWYDEAFSAEMIKHSLRNIIELGKFDVHPPFYYFLLKWWTMIVGNSEIALRGFSVLFGIFLIIGVYLLAKKLFNTKTALVASFLITIAPFFIQYSRENRMYALGAFLVVISTLFLWQAFFAKEKAKMLFYFWGYLIFTVLSAYTHYFLIFTIIAQIIGIGLGLFLADKKTRQLLWQKIHYFLITLFVAAILYLPWLPIFLKQFQEVKADYWIAPFSLVSLIRAFFVIMLGSIEVSSSLLLALPFILVLIVTLFAIKKLKSEKPEKKTALIFVLSCLFVPFILGVVVSLHRSIFLDRYFIFAGIFLFTLLAYFIAKLKRKILLPIVIVMTGVAIVAACTNVFGMDPKVTGMRELNQTLQEKYYSGEKIIHPTSFTFIIFKYYNKNEGESVVYNSSGNLPHYAGSALLAPEDVIANLAKYLGNDKHFWEIRTTDFNQYDQRLPELKNYRVQNTYQFGKESLIYYERVK